MDRLRSIAVFVEVVDRGSLTAAASTLDMSRAMVSRHLAEVETWLDVRLLHRTTRRISLTTAGETALIRCRKMLELGDDLRAALADPDGTPHGLIRVTCSTSFGQAHLAAAVSDFVQRYPGASVDMLLLDRAVNLVEERVDLAIRIARELDPNLVARKLSVCRSVLCATPAYLERHGTPLHAQDLIAHNCLTHHYVGKSVWQMTLEDRPISVPVAGNVSANDVSALMQAVRAGVGIGMLPTYLATSLVRSGELATVLPEYRLDVLGLYGVYASRRLLPPIVRSFLDFVAGRFGDEPYWDRA